MKLSPTIIVVQYILPLESNNSKLYIIDLSIPYILQKFLGRNEVI